MNNWYGDYRFCKKIKENPARDYVEFVDVNKCRHIVEVDKGVYLTLKVATCKEQSQRLKTLYHHEPRDLSEDEISEMPGKLVPDSADLVLEHIESASLWWAMSKLSATQRRRFLLHHYYGLTLKEIAVIEGCTITPVNNSIR